MTPQLTQLINGIVGMEEMLSLIEQHEMNKAHVASIQGLKRWHRYRSMDRQRHSLKLQCFMAENYHVEPTFQVNFSTPTDGLSMIDSIKYMHDRSVSHLETLKSAAKMAFDENEMLLGDYLGMMIADQSKEIDEYFRIWMDFKRDNADINYLSKELHRKVKCLEKKNFGYKSQHKYKY